MWQYQSQCFHKIGRYGAAQKCLYETLNQLRAAIESESGENGLDENYPLVQDLGGIIHPEEESLLISIDEIFGSCLKTIQASKQVIVAQCHPFLTLAANIFIQHDPLKSLISAKFALMILGRTDNEILEYILEAILKHLNKPQNSIFEQNDPETERYYITLKKLVGY